MVTKERDRDSQIKDAVFKGNFRRAQKLVKHDKGESSRKSYHDGKSSWMMFAEDEEYNTRGNRNEEWALHYLGYSGTDPKEERELKLKSAKVYHQYAILANKIFKDRAGSDYVDPEQAKRTIGAKYDLLKYGLDSIDTHHPPNIIKGIYLAFKRKKESSRGSSGLEKATATASIVGVLGGIFFLSTNITGNVIANVSQSSGNILGAVLLVVGLVAGFFWVKKK